MSGEGALSWGQEPQFCPWTPSGHMEGLGLLSVPLASSFLSTKCRAGNGQGHLYVSFSPSLSDSSPVSTGKLKRVTNHLSGIGLQCLFKAGLHSHLGFSWKLLQSFSKLYHCMNFKNMGRQNLNLL